jgi:hypothetical protein
MSASKGSLDDEVGSKRGEDVQLFALIAEYNRLTVCVRRIRKDSLVMSQEDLVELNKVNVVLFFRFFDFHSPLNLGGSINSSMDNAFSLP